MIAADRTAIEFNGHLDTPVETLHVFSLGIGRYFTISDMEKILKSKDGDENDKELRAKWASFNIRGLNIDPIVPKTLVEYYKSLVGKEFRTVMQSAPFVLYKYIGKESRDIWSNFVHLCSYIYQPEIPDLKAYLDKLALAIDAFLVALMRADARWTNKPKFHQLVHLNTVIRRWGPAKNVSADRYESLHKPMRVASVLSNHQAPSRDIANAMASGDMLGFVFSGASWALNQHTRVCAGDKVKELMMLAKNIGHLLGVDLSWNSEKELRFKCQSSF